jgi:xanthine dehydrogenase YagS FAD-binding subunit
VVVEVAGGRFRYVRLAMGGVGTKPWRMNAAEQALTGAAVDEGTIKRAAELALRDAKPQSENGFKVELAQRCLTHALRLATGMATV